MKRIQERITQLQAQVQTAQNTVNADLGGEHVEALQRVAALLARAPWPLRDHQSALRELLDGLALLAGPFPWAQSALDDLAARGGFAGAEGLHQHDLEIGKRVMTAHLFLEGQASVLDFGAVSVEGEADIRLGVGLRLHDGSLQRYLTRLAAAPRPEGDPMLFLRHTFDSEAPALAAAVAQGHTALTDYLRAQLIVRYDPRQRRRIFSLPEPWLMRFARLATDRDARQLQLEHAVGPRMAWAKNQAAAMGVNTLRGLALVFDIEALATTDGANPAHPLAAQPPRASEADRMLTLADRILARVHGRMADYWQSRMRTVIEGEGILAGRHYLEPRLLGPDADRQPWRFHPRQALREGEQQRDLSSIPVPGRDYVVQAGDQLAQIARQAFAGHADFRLILQHNPHLSSPLHLAPGMRLHIPHWPPPIERVRAPKPQNPPVQVDGEQLRVFGRSIGPLQGLSAAVLEEVAAQIRDLNPTALLRCRAVRLPDAWGVVAEGRALVVASEPLLGAAKGAFPDAEDPLRAWAEHLAAQVRGDIILSPTHFLSFGHRPGEPHRRRWVRAALQRALHEGHADAITLRCAGSGAWVDLADARGEVLVRLEQEDFAALRLQPWRRLVDLHLDPLPMALTLAQLWAGDLLANGNEVLLPPLADMRRHGHRTEEGEWRIFAPMGAPIYPIARGQVVYCGPTGASGTAILMHHGHQLYSRYTHLATLAVRPGQGVHAETVLGRVGMSGEVMEPCLGLGIEARASQDDAWRVAAATTSEPLSRLGEVWPRDGRIDVILVEG